MKKYNFNLNLIEGLIIERPNRFTMFVKLDNKIIKCFCPASTRIGNINFTNIPCLLSQNLKQGIKTNYTVEAISLDPIFKKNKKWIGINQTKANKYIEFYLKNNQFPKMIPVTNSILREKYIGKARIDFLIDNCCIEIKTFLDSLPINNLIPLKKHDKFDSHERLIKQYIEIINYSTNGNRAIILFCFFYEASRLKIPVFKEYNQTLIDLVSKAQEKGVEHWQANFKINEKGIELISYFRI